MGAASGPCHGDRRPLGAGEGGWLAIGSARAAWWDSGAIWPPGRSPAQNAVQFSLRWILPPSLPLSLSLAPSLFLRIARAGAGHRWKRIGLPRPGERPADARHPSLVSPAPAVTGARCLVLSGARESRAPLSTPRGVAVGGASRGPRQRCLATAGRFPARRVTRRFQRRLASATRVSEKPQSAAAPLGPILRCTGLPSRSALVAPPLRLAALRWRVASHFLARPRPPLGVSTAYFVAVARFSVTRFPRVPPLRMCPDRLGASAAHSQGLHARRCAPSSAPRRT
jgi:hypothetical protein